VVRYANGDTSDIIKSIMAVDTTGQSVMKPFATEVLRRCNGNEVAVCRAIWDFLKKHIRYEEDKPGTQDIKHPARLFATGFGDCKSFSLFTGAVLRHCGIPYSYRFVSYNSSATPTHVYVIAHTCAGDYIIDAVWHGFNSQKKYTHKKDIPMTKISELSGIGLRMRNPHAKRALRRGQLVINKDLKDLTEGEMDLLIAKQRLETEQDIMANVRGIGSPYVRKYQQALDVVDRALANVDRPYVIEGIGNAIGKKKKNKKGSNFIKKAAEKIKKGAKAVVKVVTAPARLAAKGVLEVALPKAAMWFLYLFLNDPKIIDQLPAKVRKKRKVQEKIAKIIVDGIGMKRAHFMGILRNGIMKKAGKSPETLLASMTKSKVSGIGVIPVALILGLIPLVTKLLQQLFPKKNVDEAELKEGSPGDDDWAEVSSELSDTLSTEIKKQDDSPITQGGSGGGGGDGSGGSDGGSDGGGGDAGGGDAGGGGENETGGRKTAGWC
jgi:uncharacterized membrane protein YgcG